MKILSVDCGIKMGFCYKNGEDEESGHEITKGLIEWGDLIKGLLTTWKPDILVMSQANSFGYFKALRSACMMNGIAFYICGKMWIVGVELNDSSARKTVLGKAMKKKEVQAMFPDIQGDELDAIILARAWHKLNQNENTPSTDSPND